MISHVMACRQVQHPIHYCEYCAIKTCVRIKSLRTKALLGRGEGTFGPPWRRFWVGKGSIDRQGTRAAHPVGGFVQEINNSYMDEGEPPGRPRKHARCLGRPFLRPSIPQSVHPSSGASSTSASPRTQRRFLITARPSVIIYRLCCRRG